MATDLNTWILFVLYSFVMDFQVKAVTPLDQNATNGSFLENTRYCDCPPLTEFDEGGNHIWQINIIRPNTNICKAMYTCRQGYQSEVVTPNHTRFCFSQNAWNHTEIDCKKIDTMEESTVMYIAVPSSLLAVLCVVMVLFVLWWQRRVKHRTGEEKINDVEKSTMELFHIRGDTNTKRIADDQQHYGNAALETDIDFQIGGDDYTNHAKDEERFANTTNPTVDVFHNPEKVDNKENDNQIYLTDYKRIVSVNDLRSTI